MGILARRTQENNTIISKNDNITLIVSCEHATNHIPKEFKHLFKDRAKELLSHRGYDPGAHEFARLLAGQFKAPIFTGKVSRLLVDLNRSPTNHRSPPVQTLLVITPTDREQILQRFYHPYRQAIKEAVSASIQQGLTTLHISVHSFTPVLNGIERTADIGLLYDPSRKQESILCDQWLKVLTTKNGGLRIRRNYPYRGNSDGVVTSLRKRYADPKYLGIELEINQLFPKGRKIEWKKLQLQLLESLIEVLTTS